VFLPEATVAPGMRANEERAADVTWARVRRQTQLVVHLPHGPQSLGTTLNSAIARGLQVLAHCSLPDAGGTTWLLVVADDWLGREALEAAGYRTLAEQVVLVEASPRASAAARLGRSLAETDIAVLYSYAMPGSDDRLIAVFKTADDERVLRILQAQLGAPESQGRKIVA
jgi:hypothetical protein